MVARGPARRVRPAARTPARAPPRGGHRHEAAQPQTRQRRRRRRPAPGRRPARAPPRAASAPSGTAEVDLDETSTGRRAAPRPGSSASARDSRSTEWTTAPQPGDRGRLVALQLADEVPAQREVGQLGRLASSSCARFSPKSTCPSAARARTSPAGHVLLTAIRRTDAGSGRPRARRRDARQTARRFSSRAATRQLSWPGRSAHPARGGAMRGSVAAPRVPWGRQLPARSRSGCHVSGAQPSQTTPACRPVTPSRRWENSRRSSTVQRGSCTTWPTPAARSTSSRPARRSRPGVPGAGAGGGAGRHPRDLGLHRRGHLVAGAADGGPEQRGDVAAPGPEAAPWRPAPRARRQAHALAAGVHGGRRRRRLGVGEQHGHAVGDEHAEHQPAASP